MKIKSAFVVSVLFLALQACESTTSIDIGSVGETMAYDKTSFEVKAGSKVKLTLKNNATSPAMQHDWVLVKPGAEKEVIDGSMQAGAAKGYIPDSPNIVAHTKLLPPGQSDTVEFTAPTTPGDYPYFCTFPGHWALMKGTMKVTP